MFKLAGRLDFSLVISLLFVILQLRILYVHLSMFNLSTILYYLVINVVVLLSFSLKSKILCQCCYRCFGCYHWLLSPDSIYSHCTWSGMAVVCLGLDADPNWRLAQGTAKLIVFRRGRCLSVWSSGTYRACPLKENELLRNVPFYVCKDTGVIKSRYTPYECQYHC